MTQEQKAKAYDEALEKAKAHINSKGIGDTVDLCKHLFSELNESEDEKVIRTLFFLCKDHDWLNGATKEECLNWLEKRKENSKSADSIPSDCVSDAKCEDRWHKTANSLPDNGRDVLAKDALGNYLIASFDGAQWFVSVYDGQDHPVLHTPPILEWCDIETCEESLHISETCKENADSFTDEDERIRKELINFLQSPFIKDNLTDEKVAPWLTYLEKQKEQKPAEWSEEDERMLSRCEKSIESSKQFADSDTFKKAKDNEIDWLENRFKSLRPSWKPSEEQMEAMEFVIKDYREDGCTATANYLQEILDQIKKL